jgi:hypothetical protein
MSVLVRLRRFAGQYLPAVPRARLRSVRRARDAAERRVETGAAAFEEVVAAVESREARAAPANPSRSAAAGVRAKVQGIRAHATFAQMLGAGASLEEAATATVRELLTTKPPAAAADFADALAARQETEIAGRLAVAIVAWHRKLPALAWAKLNTVPTPMWRRHAAAEYLDSGFRQEPATALRAARDLVADRAAELGPAQWYEVLRHAYVVRDLSLARQAYDLLVERARHDPTAWPAAETEITWLRPWLDSELTADPAPPPAGSVAFALINYRQPGLSKGSQNIGDYVQTLASLGHLLRHQNLRFHGSADLVELVEEMQHRVRVERRLDSVAADLQLYTVERDASTYQGFPEPTWMLAFGWFMHPIFKLRHDFPMHPNLRPIFVSFHCNKREMLTPPALDYLRRYGPVGCRDWTTVDLLLSLDVPAFFSGCITTTVDTLFPALDTASRPTEPRPVYIDVRSDVPRGVPTATQSYPEVKQRSFVANLREAVALLERYRHTYTRVITSRLHCYLPVRSLGLEVDFRPKNRADVRFNGLIDIDDVAFEAIRNGILDRLEPVLGAIVGGETEKDVYRLWQELCADDVNAALVRHGEVSPAPEAPFDVTETRYRFLARATADGSPGTKLLGQAVDIAILAGHGDHARLPVLLDSLLAGTAHPLQVWMLSRGSGPAERGQLAEAFPELSIRWLPCDEVEYSHAYNSGPGDRDLLLLPELVDTERVVVLPPAAVVLGDVAELAGQHLDGYPLAARSSVGIGLTSGFGVFYRAARRLDPRADLAHDLYRRVHARHVFDFDAFDTEVLVLDLQTMRRDRFGTEFLPYAGHFRFTAREVLTFYAGPKRAAVPLQWAHVPTRERVDNPKLIHWVDRAPWQSGYVRHRETWVRASELAARRTRRVAAPVEA